MAGRGRRSPQDHWLSDRAFWIIVVLVFLATDGFGLLPIVRLVARLFA